MTYGEGTKKKKKTFFCPQGSPEVGFGSERLQSSCFIHTHTIKELKGSMTIINQ